MVLSKMNNHEHRTKQTYESYTLQPLMSFWFYRNKINHLIRISKRGYFHDYFEKNLENMKNWEALNNLLNRKTKKSRHVNAIRDFNNGNKINRNPQR